MSRFSIRTGVTFALLAALLAACEKAADDQAKAEKAQAVASDKLTSATVEANDKAIAAQAEADKQIAEARASFTRRREDYRHAMTTDLVALDERVAKAAAKSETLSGSARADVDAKLARIRASRDVITTDYNQLETATAITWDDAKSRVDVDMNAFRKVVDDL